MSSSIAFPNVNLILCINGQPVKEIHTETRELKTMWLHNFTEEAPKIGQHRTLDFAYVFILEWLLRIEVFTKKCETSCQISIVTVSGPTTR